MDSSFEKNYKKEYSLHLHTSIFDKTKCNDEYKYKPFPYILFT